MILKSIYNVAGERLRKGALLTSHIAGMVGILGMVAALLFICPEAHALDGQPRVQMQNPPVVALRTNLLFDALVLPNIGIEVALPMNFSLAADWFGTWISSKKSDFFWQGYGGYLSARWYFGKQAAECPMTGHHVGIYGSCLTHDIEFGGKGYQADKMGFGGGVEYGYSLPIASCLCMDFNIGVGYQGGTYKTYQPANDGTGHYVWLATHKRRWWGPTKAEISLKWLIAPVTKKGGKK